MVKNSFQIQIFSILWVEKLVFYQLYICIFLYCCTSFINTDIGKQYLTRFSASSNQMQHNFDSFCFFGCFFIFSKDSQKE